VAVDYEELPAVVDAQAGDVLLRWEHSEGDVDGTFASAAHVTSLRIRVPRLVAAPLEPRAARAAYDAADDLVTLWLSAQYPPRPAAVHRRSRRVPLPVDAVPAAHRRSPASRLLRDPRCVGEGRRSRYEHGPDRAVPRRRTAGGCARDRAARRRRRPRAGHRPH